MNLHELKEMVKEEYNKFMYEQEDDDKKDDAPKGDDKDKGDDKPKSKDDKDKGTPKKASTPKVKAGKDDVAFVKLEQYDRRINMCDQDIKDYKEQIKYLRKKIAREQTRKDNIQKEKLDCILEWDMDYKTIEK